MQLRGGQIRDDPCSRLRSQNEFVCNTSRGREGRGLRFALRGACNFRYRFDDAVISSPLAIGRFT